jgi:hypothetical protein
MTLGQDIVKIDRSEAAILLGQHNMTGKDWTDILDMNGAFVYDLPDGRVILESAEKGADTALLYPNRDMFDRDVAKGEFPIDNVYPTIFEANNVDMFRIKSELPKWLDYLSKEYGKAIDPSDKQSMLGLIEWVKKKKKRFNEDDKFQVAFALVYGEFIRLRYDGKWILQKRYSTFNPIYLPIIEASSGELVNVISAFEMPIKFPRAKSIDVLIKLQPLYTRERQEGFGSVFIEQRD